MRFEIVTIFPDFFTGFFENGILSRALARELVTVGVHDLRAFTHDRHRTVDDRPFGGGEGMVLKPQPLAEALASLGIAPKAERDRAILSGELPSEVKALTDSANPLPPPPSGSSFSDFSVKGTGFSVKGTGFSMKGTGFSMKGTGFSMKGTGFSMKGTGFSPYIDAAKESGALAPEGTPSENSPSAPKTRVILLSAQGPTFTQAMARELAALDRVVLICGRYEGVDERINQLYCDQELSIGDYVLSGGELAAAVVVDATMRLLPGVLGNEASSEFESFGVADAEIADAEDGVPRSQYGAGGLLDYPHYTRPAEFGGLPAPEVLLNGDHHQIRLWRREQQLRKTLANRPDLLEHAALSKEDRKILEAIRRETA